MSADTSIRVLFALQYFQNDAIIAHVDRLVRCACESRQVSSWHLIVHQDDGLESHTQRWQRKLRDYGRNATLILSDGIHEVRAYNMMVRMRDDIDLAVLLQDDDVPPRGCAWLEVPPPPCSAACKRPTRVRRAPPEQEGRR